MKTLKAWAAAAAFVAASGAAQAALFDRGGGMIYDDVANITWLADMNYAATSGYDSDGLMSWAAAVQWADSLVYGGHSDWRLPTLNPSDTTCSDSFSPGGGFPTQHNGVNCTGGELSHLFVADLGNRAFESVLNQVGDTTEQLANMSLFSNVQSYDYWSGTVYAPEPAFAWRFYSNGGGQYDVYAGVELYAVAVRPGDMAAPIPEPQTYMLMLAGLGAMAVMMRRRPG